MLIKDRILGHLHKGRVVQLDGSIAYARISGVKIGELCYIESEKGAQKPAEAVAFKDNIVKLLLLSDAIGIRQDSPVTATGSFIKVPAGDCLLGHVIDALGRPIDGSLLDISSASFIPIEASAPRIFERPEVTEMFSTGIRAIDSCLTLGCGQRMGLFAGTGVGKNTLLGMIARNSDADVNVIALIGERGREVKEFVEDALESECMKKTVVVCSMGEQVPSNQQKCLLTATAICEYFRDQGKKVLLIADSINRFISASQEIALSLGDSPTLKGYPPSIFKNLQKILERSGNAKTGSITALYVVLMEGDDVNNPIVDAVRGATDGHMFLSRKVAESNHYPAIDILRSISRLMYNFASNEHRRAVAKMRILISLYRENIDLIESGQYVGTNPKLDLAIEMMPKINAFLQQRTSDSVNMQNTIDTLINMMAGVDI